MRQRLTVLMHTHHNYGGAQRKVPVVTIELPHAQEMPSDAEVERIWRDMLHWIGRNVTGQKLADAKVPGLGGK